ncbi:uncharacterized protein EHS24_000150 [Apiotrichum porosum]|uniref:Uncharacterized protein n=1 Tax=Apiotrichum porosum TaxID=105984 RepID=A0A427Y9L7_9TREE|nr:uncharacterized protein EHS24_000150 [Apiotrichum porosum]RSH87637.1 hypothetical protein EHS24_000150 [Apiotrichum porosum]
MAHTPTMSPCTHRIPSANPVLYPIALLWGSRSTEADCLDFTARVLRPIAVVELQSSVMM